MKKMRKKIYECTIPGVILYIKGYRKKQRILELKELDGNLRIDLPFKNVKAELTPCGSLKKAREVITKRNEREHRQFQHVPLSFKQRRVTHDDRRRR
jgi:hypothetical protein